MPSSSVSKKTVRLPSSWAAQMTPEVPPEPASPAFMGRRETLLQASPGSFGGKQGTGKEAPNNVLLASF